MLVLKAAIVLTSIQSILSTDTGSLDSARKSIVLNDVNTLSISRFSLKD